MSFGIMWKLWKLYQKVELIFYSSSSKLKPRLKIKGFCPTFICKFKRRTNWSYKAAASVCNSKDITYFTQLYLCWTHVWFWATTPQEKNMVEELQATNFIWIFHGKLDNISSAFCIIIIILQPVYVLY